MGSFSTQVQWAPTGSNWSTMTSDVVVVPVFQADKPKASDKTKKGSKSDKSEPSLVWTSVLTDLDKAMGGALKPLVEAEKFTGAAKKIRVLPLRSTDKVKAKWVALVGLGSADKLELKKVVEAYDAAFKATLSFKSAADQVALVPEATKQISSEAMVQGIIFGAYRSTYQTAEAKKEDQKKLKSITLVSAKSVPNHAHLVQVATTMAQAESTVKDLANMPANLKTAQTLADFASSLKSKPGVKVQVIDNVAQIKKQFPAFYAVAQGSVKSDPPRFIHLTYTPVEGRVGRHIALVGKGVIFDTGGVQVKPGEYMNDMKFDMTGAATVLGVFKAITELQLPGVKVSTFVAATKNATGEYAYLPDSIIDSSSGKKIEIRHTDAEGRLTLADAVYTAAQEKPDEMVTIATLTGAAMLAVGHCTALMGMNADLVKRIETASKAVGERIQALELFDEDFENIKSARDAADLANVSKAKNRGHMSAGAFVMSFAQEVPVAHLDIAGGDALEGNATGIATKGLIQYVMQASKEHGTMKSVSKKSSKPAAKKTATKKVAAFSASAKAAPKAAAKPSPVKAVSSSKPAAKKSAASATKSSTTVKLKGKASSKAKPKAKTAAKAKPASKVTPLKAKTAAKPAAKKVTAKKTTTKKTTAKKPTMLKAKTAAKPAAKKTTAKAKPVAKKPVAKKTTAKAKPAVKAVAPKKPAAKKPAAKKPMAKAKPVAKKPTAKAKPAAKAKTATKPAAAKAAPKAKSFKPKAKPAAKKAGGKK